MNRVKRILFRALMLACVAIGGAGIWSFVMAVDPAIAVGGLIGGLGCLVIGVYGLYTLKKYD